MPDLTGHLVVGSLPDTLVPHGLYAVLKDIGFDLYLTDTDGVAEPLNRAPFVTFTDRAAYDAYAPGAGEIALFSGPAAG